MFCEFFSDNIVVKLLFYTSRFVLCVGQWQNHRVALSLYISLFLSLSADLLRHPAPDALYIFRSLVFSGRSKSVLLTETYWNIFFTSPDSRCSFNLFPEFQIPKFVPWPTVQDGLHCSIVVPSEHRTRLGGGSRTPLTTTTTTTTTSLSGDCSDWWEEFL